MAEGVSCLFCPDQTGHSLCLPDLFRQMCEKPTHQIALTAKTIGQSSAVQIPSPMFEGEKYWVFFRVNQTAF